MAYPHRWNNIVDSKELQVFSYIVNRFGFNPTLPSKIKYHSEKRFDQDVSEIIEEFENRGYLVRVSRCQYGSEDTKPFLKVSQQKESELRKESIQSDLRCF